LSRRIHFLITSNKTSDPRLTTRTKKHFLEPRLKPPKTQVPSINRPVINLAYRTSCHQFRPRHQDHPEPRNIFQPKKTNLSTKQRPIDHSLNRNTELHNKKVLTRKRNNKPQTIHLTHSFHRQMNLTKPSTNKERPTVIKTTTNILTNLPPITPETKTCKITTTDSTTAFTPPLSKPVLVWKLGVHLISWMDVSGLGSVCQSVS